jgi:hypothetical protein
MEHIVVLQATIEGVAHDIEFAKRNILELSFVVFDERGVIKC